MSARSLRRQLGREWLVALSAYALIVAPFGCAFNLDLLGGSDVVLDTASTGLFVNANTDAELVAGGRDTAGDTFFVYGAMDGAGTITDVDAILVKERDGTESFIVFEQGRPNHLQDGDGNYIHIAYTNVSSTRLDADVTLYDAETEATETLSAVIDPLAGVLSATQELESLTGVEVEVPDVPDVERALAKHKAGWLIALAVIPLVLVTQLLVVVMAAVMSAVVAAVVVAFQAVAIAALAPFLLFGALLSSTISLDVEATPLLDVFVELPGAPEIEVDIGV